MTTVGADPVLVAGSISVAGVVLRCVLVELRWWLALHDPAPPRNVRKSSEQCGGASWAQAAAELEGPHRAISSCQPLAMGRRDRADQRSEVGDGVRPRGPPLDEHRAGVQRLQAEQNDTGGSGVRASGLLHHGGHGCADQAAPSSAAASASICSVIHGT